MDILHLPTNVAGMPWALAQGQKSLGHDVTLLTRNRTGWNYPSEEVLDLDGKSRVGRLVSCLSALFRHARTHDAYVFNFGQSLLHYPERGLGFAELPLYPAKARKVFLYQGCDARQKYPTMRRNQALGNDVAACFAADCYGGACNSGERDKQRIKSIERAAKFADHMFAVNPDLLYFLPRGQSSFLPYTMPSMISEDAKSRAFFADDTVHIVHAPTQRGAKGTAFILKALEDVKARLKCDVQVSLVENKTNAETLEILRTADLFIDQVLIGWYGGAAVEAMNMGVPVVAYINEDHLQFVPDDMVSEMPIINARPLELADIVCRVIDDRERIVATGADSQRFARRWHDPIAVARMIEPFISV